MLFASEFIYLCYIIMLHMFSYEVIPKYMYDLRISLRKCVSMCIYVYMIQMAIHLEELI